MVNASLAEYHVPVQMDVPKIDILYTNTTSIRGRRWVRIGEIGITGVGGGRC